MERILTFLCRCCRAHGLNELLLSINEMLFSSSGTAVSLGSVRLCRPFTGQEGAEGVRGAQGRGTPHHLQRFFKPLLLSLLPLETRRYKREPAFLEYCVPGLPIHSRESSQHSSEGMILSCFTAKETEAQRHEVTALRSHSL